MLNLVVIWDVGFFNCKVQKENIEESVALICAALLNRKVHKE